MAVAPDRPEPHRFDPVRRCYLDALERRAALAEGPVQALLAQRLAAGRAAYEAGLAAARAQTQPALVELQTRFPAAADTLRKLWERGDFAAMHRLGLDLAERQQPSPLAGLLKHIDRPAGGPAAAPTATITAAASATEVPAPRELRAVRHARGTWARLRVDRQLTQSLARLPDNPGPLNSQRLVLRCLQRLQALSPGYLAGLMAQLDTLVWLEQAAVAAPREVPTSKAARSARDKTR